jgi:hypothetical protein
MHRAVPPLLQYFFIAWCLIKQWICFHGHAWGRGEVFTVFWLGGPKVKRQLGRRRRRWEDNIKLDLMEIGIDGANWIRLAQDRVHWRAFVNTVMNLRIFFDRLSDYQIFK